MTNRRLEDPFAERERRPILYANCEGLRERYKNQDTCMATVQNPQYGFLSNFLISPSAPKAPTTVLRPVNASRTLEELMLPARRSEPLPPAPGGHPLAVVVVPAVRPRAEGRLSTPSSRLASATSSSRSSLSHFESPICVSCVACALSSEIEADPE